MTSAIRDTDVSPIADYSKDDFASWFEDGFRSLGSQKCEIAGNAFYPIHNLLADLSVFERLEAIYRALPDRAGTKARFRLGLAVAFERFARDHILSQRLMDVLHLATLIVAEELSPRLVPVLTQVGAGAYESRLLSHALTYLASLAPFSAAPETIRDLLSLPDATSRLSIFGWLTMCRCDPAHWVDHLEALRESIRDALHAYAGNNSVITAARFAAYVPLTQVARQLWRLQYYQNSELGRGADNWLLNALVKLQDSPYRVWVRDGHLLLAYRDAPDSPLEPIAESEARKDDTTWFLGNASRVLLPPGRDFPSPVEGPVKADWDALMSFGKINMKAWYSSSASIMVSDADD